MDGKVKAALDVLGFVESNRVEKLPKFKYITKKYHKLAMIHHPDRPGGNEEVFKEISEAYLFLGGFFEQKRKEGNLGKSNDFEEEVARQTFNQFQSSKVK
jgi:curved DNA-binding protein CbpA